MLALLLLATTTPELEAARDSQDRTALERIAADLAAGAAKKPDDADAHLRHATAQSYAAEVALEKRDREGARRAATEGIRSAERAVALKPDVSEHHRILGTLCGQIIPANVLAGLKYGKCAKEEIERAVALDPKSALNYLSRGIGNYYLPAAFGGGAELAIKDFEKAIALDSKLAEAHLWLGLGLRKLNRNAQARQAFSKSLQLNPRRVWVKEQLDKTAAE
jgi:tetratricopeptide (TPR) repeat protein